MTVSLSRHLRSFAVAVAALFVLGLASPTLGLDFNWTGTCNESWYGCCTIDGSQLNNWDQPPGSPPDCPPYPGAGATVRLGAGSHVFLNGGGAPPTIGRLFSDGTTFDLFSPLTVINEILFDGTFHLVGQSLTVGPVMRINGLMRWSGGTISGDGATEALGGLRLEGFGTHALSGRNLFSPGDGFWTGTGHMDLADGAVFETQGAFEIQCDRTVFGTTGGGTFWNRGTVLKTQTLGETRFLAPVTVDNDGVFSITSGSVLIEGPGRCTGIYHVDPGTTLHLNPAIVPAGSQEFDLGADFTGSGLVRISGLVVCTEVTSVSVENLEMRGGIIDNAGTFTIENLDCPNFAPIVRGPGTMSVSNSTILDGFSFTVSEQRVDFGQSTVWSEGHIIVAGGGELRNGVTLVALGASDDILFQGTSGTLVNPSEATMTLSRTLAISGPDQFDNGTVANAGTLTLAGTGTSFIQNGTKVQNSGLFHVQNGEVRMTTGSTYTQTAGITRIDTGATFWIQTPATFTGGRIEGGGTLRIPNFVNGGVEIAPGASPGILTILGSYTQQTVGALEIQLGGLVAGTEHDVLQVIDTATLDGTLELARIDGFVPVVGDQVTVLSANTIQGEFSSVVLTDFPAGTEATVDVGNQTVVVTFTAVATDAGSPIAESDAWVFGSRLLGARPNPAPGGRFELLFRKPTADAGDSHVGLVVYDLAGRQVRALASGARGTGTQTVHWDGSDDRGIPVGTGIYFARLTIGSPGRENVSETLRLTVLR